MDLEAEMKTNFRLLFLPAALLVIGGVSPALKAGTICPDVGVAAVGTGANAGTGCFVLFTYSNDPNGGLQITRTIDPTVGRYDSVDGDDVTVGVVNDVVASAAPFFVTELDLTATNPFGDFSGPNIFNFDGDGICDVTPSASASCPFVSSGPVGSIANGYSGPNVTFQALSLDSGIVFFNNGGIAAGTSDFFGLEDVPSGATPEPAAVLLLSSGLALLVLLRRKQVV
jgi:hypothetical protein